MEIWILTFDDGTESAAFSTREKAREHLNNTINSFENVEDFHICDEPCDDFEYYHYHNGYEKVEAIIEKLIVDKEC